MKGYWDLLAGQFQHQQPPLRPCADDIRVFERIILGWHRRHSPPRINALLFGVTPEIAGLSWPAGTFLLAVEKSQAMIDLVWPGDIPNQRKVVRGNWLEVEIEKNSLDLIVGDGFLTGMVYPRQYNQIAEAVSQWLKPGGLLIARLFVRPDKSDSMEAILGDLENGRIAQFDAFKWRLAMAMQESPEQGVRVDAIYRAWSQLENQRPTLPEQAGWPRETVNTIKFYAGRSDIYAFPTIQELTRAFSAHLEPMSTTMPDYDFGQSCPILVFRRRIQPASEKAVDAGSKP